MSRLVSVLGLFVFLGLCWAASNRRPAIRWRLVAWGMGLQLLFALVILKTAPGEAVFRWLSNAFARLIGFTDDGARFVWGWLFDHYKSPSAGGGPIFLVDILMTIVFFAALMSLLYHVGLMQPVVSGIARLMRKTMGTSGAETLSASANIFVGQTEAPLVVKPFVAKMTMSELHAVMVGGFATIAGGVLAAYVRFGVDAGHLVAASFMSAPAALVAAKMFYPETETSATAGDVRISVEKETANVFDAVCVGAGDGLRLALNVVAMLLAFISIIAMLNWGIAEAHRWFEPAVQDPLSLQKILGWLFAPVAWLMGIPWQDCPSVGGLLGIRMVLNEFIAYDQLMKIESLSPRAFVVSTYAFCGFANFASIGVQIGGISAFAPSRRADLARLGLRAMLAGTVACFLTACIAGALLSDEQVERDFRRNKARVAADPKEKARHLDAFLEKYPQSPYADEFRRAKAEPAPK